MLQYMTFNAEIAIHVINIPHGDQMILAEHSTVLL